MASIGAAIMFGASDGGSIQADGTVLRAFAGVGQFLSANDPSGTGGVAGLGGAFILGDCLEPRDLAGAVIAGSFTGAFLVNVGAQTGVQAKIGAASSITVGGILNPVAIAGTLQAADASGTRIVGGLPYPGGWGPSVQRVSATGDTWDGVSATVVLISATIGVGGVFNLPATNLVTTGAKVQIKNQDGVNTVLIDPDVLGNIDGGGAGVSISLGSAGARASLILVNESVVAATARNWMIF
jgi:hypothetical protein